MFVFSYVQNCFKKKKRKKKEKKEKKQLYKANKKFLQFQLRGVVGGISRVVGELEFL
jgi:hypothetical protein